jgi:hypothetical protein
MTGVWQKLLLTLILASGCLAQARVFTMSKESFAPYLRGTYMPMSMTDGVYSGALGSGSSAETKMKYDASGEFGVVYGNPNVSVRLGVEYLMVPRVSENAANTSGTALYSIDSQTTVLTPKLALEFNLKTWQEGRLFFMAGAGYANLSSKNSYAFTGASTYGLSDFSESLKATTIMEEASFGFEGLMSDATTFAFELGYRNLKFDKIKYSNSDTGFGGAFSSGDTAMNTDGSKRTLNLSNVFIGISLRFWLK